MSLFSLVRLDTLVTEVDGDVKQYPAGIAHFLEHKLFEREDSSDLMSAFTSLGADSNAFTSFTKTNYSFFNRRIIILQRI